MDDERSIIDDFYRHVREGQPFWIDATEAMRALSVISSVYAQSTAPPRVRQECGVSDALPAKLFGLALRIIEPIRGPHPVEPPTEPFENFLSEAITVPR